MEEPYGYNTVGPLPFGHVRFYGPLNRQAVYTRSAGRIYSGPETRDWLRTVLPACGNARQLLVLDGASRSTRMRASLSRFSARRSRRIMADLQRRLRHSGARVAELKPATNGRSVTMPAAKPVKEEKSRKKAPAAKGRAGAAKKAPARGAAKTAARKAAPAKKAAKKGAARGAAAKYRRGVAQKEAAPKRKAVKWINSPEEHEDRPGQTLATRNHEVIMQWARERNAVPATIEGTGPGDRPGVLTFDFPGFAGPPKLKPISREEWFRPFDERNLTFLFQEHLRNGNQSNFFRLENPEREDA